jgi:hypothetical protein
MLDDFHLLQRYGHALHEIEGDGHACERVGPLGKFRLSRPDVSQC